MALYHKYRPQELSQVRGNSEIVSSLEKMLQNPKMMAHTILLSGETGCGKTTIARIIKTHLGITDNDFTEINSSDFRGIDTIRDIIKNASYKPMNSPYRMYLMDEVHQLTKDAQNGLLKLLEDTPQHVFFVLCTTDPDKLLKAIVGRCLWFAVKPLTEREMKGLLKRITKDEGETIEPEILDQIVLDSTGHPRNAINILEKVLAVEPEQRLEIAQQTARETNQSIDLCRALMGGKGWKEVQTILSGLNGQEPESIRRVVLGYASAVLMKGDNPKAGLILECFIEPFYNSGFPGLVFACYSVIKN